MPATKKLSTQQIGKLGELLVQYELLRQGIDSAHLTTDSGIDLVAYSHLRATAYTIQVKTNLKPKPGGGKGRPSLDWWIADDSPAQLFAFADISTNRVWLLDQAELARHAQQHPAGRFHFYMNIEEVTHRNSSTISFVEHFDNFLIQNRVAAFFGST